MQTKILKLYSTESTENSRSSVPRLLKGISDLENKEGGLGLRRINQLNLKIQNHLLLD
jgi:hypothetical protein